MQVSDTVEITGHLLDSGILSMVLDDIREYDGDYAIDRFDVGKDHTDASHAWITVTAADDDSLQRLLMRLQTRGVNLVDPGEAATSQTVQDGVFPDGFYSTTNLDTLVRISGRWSEVVNPEMDCGLVVEGEGASLRVRTVPMADVKAGMQVICGAQGVKVRTPEPPRGAGGMFGFMESDVSSEKPQTVLVRQVADGMREAKAAGKLVLWVGGPGVVHTGAAPAMTALVEAGYVDVLFAGNALATHDIESALYGTSLGVDLARFHPGRRARAAETRVRAGLPEGPLALYVGRMAGEKDIDLLLAAWSEVERRTGARLVLVGDGPARRSLQRAPGAERAIWIAHERDRDRLADLYAAVDLYVAPGPAETFGLAALEALSSGLPILSVDQGGVAETVQHSGAGRLYASGERAHLTEVAVALLGEDLPGLGAVGRRYAETHHGWDTVFDRLFQVYRSLIAR